ncbi:hypothetical protein PAMP_008890 [Pampus punctatissimus]
MLCCLLFLICYTQTFTYKHTAVSQHTVAVRLGSSSRLTEGGEGRRKLAQRETGALISDRLTGCVDKAVAQEEEKKRCNGRTSCLNTRSKAGGTTKREREREREREGTNGEKSLRGEKSFGAARRSKLDEADNDVDGTKHTEKPSLTGERSKAVRAKSGKEGEEEEEREPDRRSSLQGLTDTKAKRRRRRSMRAS